MPLSINRPQNKYENYVIRSWKNLENKENTQNCKNLEIDVLDYLLASKVNQRTKLQDEIDELLRQRLEAKIAYNRDNFVGKCYYDSREEKYLKVISEKASDDFKVTVISVPLVLKMCFDLADRLTPQIKAKRLLFGSFDFDSIISEEYNIRDLDDLVEIDEKYFNQAVDNFCRQVKEIKV